MLIILGTAVPALAQEPPFIKDVEVTPTTFSPNADGVGDLLYVRYTLEVDASRVTAAVRDSNEAHVAALLEGAYVPAGTDTLIWDGLKDNAVLAADGRYFVHITARFDYEQEEADSPPFVLDATTPTGRISEVFPKPFTPGLPPTPDSLTIHLTVSGSQATDSISVGIGPEEKPVTDLLSLTPPFSGDGDYTAVWKDKGYEDGYYRVEVFMQDAALNESVDDHSFLLDRSPPLIEILDPADGEVFNELPEFFQAMTFDESGVESTEASYDGGPFTTIQGVGGRDTLFWSAPLRDLLAGAGDHTVSVRATDLLRRVGARGYGDGAFTLTVTVDTTAPSRPSITPLPSVVRTARLEVSGIAEDADSVEIYLNDFEKPAVESRVTNRETFSAVLELSVGVNEIGVISVDEAGNKSPISLTATVEYRQEFGVFFEERFRPGSYFEISLETPAREVALALYSTSGRLVRILRADGPSSHFSVTWDGYDSSGNPLNNGVYLCRVNAVMQDGTALTQKKLVALVR